MKTCFVYSYRYPPSYSVGAKRNHAIVSALSQRYDRVTVFTSKLIGWQSTSRYINPPNANVVFIPSLENIFRPTYLFLVKIFLGITKLTLSRPFTMKQSSQHQTPLNNLSALCAQKSHQPLITARDIVKFANGIFWPLIAVLITPYFFVRFRSLPDLTAGLTMPSFCVCPCLVLKWLLGISYILDIRDCWTGNPGEQPPSILSQLLLSQLERTAVRSSTMTTVVTSGLKQLIKRNNQVKVLPNTFVRADLKAYSHSLSTRSHTHQHCNSDLTLSFAYFGTIERSRNKSLLYFVEAMNNASLSIPIDFSIDIYASAVSTDVTMPSVDYLNIFPAVSLEEVVRIQQASSVLLALTGDVSISYPVKLNEYMLSGKPIIIVGSKFSEEVLRIPTLSVSPVLILDASIPASCSTKLLLDFFSSIKNYKVDADNLLASYKTCTVEDSFLSLIHDILP